MLLGFKFDAWEGGHRIPFIARWSGKIPAGSKSNQLICNVDLIATLAVLTGGLVKAPPAINTLLSSSLTDPRGAEVVAALGDALVSARSSVPAPPRGLRGLWSTLRGAAKDPDVTRGLAYLIEVARVFGRKV